MVQAILLGPTLSTVPHYCQDPPGDDMITRLAHVTENNQKLTKNQIICTVILLLNAGHEATVNTIGNSIVTLANNNIDTLNLDKKMGRLSLINIHIKAQCIFACRLIKQFLLDEDQSSLLSYYIAIRLNPLFNIQSLPHNICTAKNPYLGQGVESH